MASAPRRAGAPLQAVGAALILTALQAVRHGLGGMDDAFITFRYARNWVHGLGIVYNAGERAEGYTNFLWLVLVAPFIRLGLDPLLPAQVLGGLAMAATGVLTFRAAASAMGPRAGLLAACLFFSCGPVFVWSFAGLETPLVALLLMTMATVAGRTEPAPREAAAIGLIAALGTMARPDFVAGALGAGVAWVHARGRRDGRIQWREVSRAAAAFLLLYGPYFAWRWSYYGSLLPNTFHAKVGATGSQILRGVAYVLDGMGNSGGVLVWLGLPMIALLGASLTRTAAALVSVLAAASAAHVFYVVLVGGDGLGMGRFLVAAVAPLCTLAAIGLAVVEDGLERLEAPRLRWAGRGLAAGAVLAILLGSLFGAQSRAHRVGAGQVVYFSEQGRWLREHTRADDLIAVHAAGATPYYAERPTLDMLGLTDIHIGRLDVARMGTGRPGHEKRDYDYVLERRPAYVLHVDGEEPPAPQLRAAGYTRRGIVSRGVAFTLWVRPGAMDPGDSNP